MLRHRSPLFTVALCVVATLSSCEPRTVEIQGLDELTSEIRSQRLLNRRRDGDAQRGAGDPNIEAKQIHLAMDPLREALAQLASSQRDLSGRQATLTQEMRRWTQLLVASMQSGDSEEAKKLSKRLADLENTIAAQDVRHREVEEMLGSALDRTADQLEDFLKRLGAGLTDSGTEKAQEAKPTNGPDDAVKAATPRTAAPPAGGQAGAPDKQPPRPSDAPPARSSRANGDGEQASLDWLWLTLALLSMGAGIVLLRGNRKRSRVTPAARSPVVDPALQESSLATGESAWPQALAEDPEKQPAPDGEADPEIEELWATAALLGEAIGRLKETSDPSAPDDPTSRAAPELDELDDIVIVADAGIDADAHIDARRGADFEVVQDASDSPPSGDPMRSQQIEAARPSLVEQAAAPTAAEDRPELLESTGLKAPLTCRLSLPSSPQTEDRVRRLLGADPRVLISPAPQIHSAMGGLEVSFALIPGLPDGERSLLEQQLRETCA
jgi:hypothetical protein